MDSGCHFAANRSEAGRESAQRSGGGRAPGSQIRSSRRGGDGVRPHSMLFWCCCCCCCCPCRASCCAHLGDGVLRLGESGRGRGSERGSFGGGLARGRKENSGRRGHARHHHHHHHSTAFSATDSKAAGTSAYNSVHNGIMHARRSFSLFLSCPDSDGRSCPSHADSGVRPSRLTGLVLRGSQNILRPRETNLCEMVSCLLQYYLLPAQRRELPAAPCMTSTGTCHRPSSQWDPGDGTVTVLRAPSSAEQ